MGDRPVFTEFACSQLAAGIAIGSCDPPISRSCARRRLDPLAAIFKGAERIQALNGKLDAYRVFHSSFESIWKPLSRAIRRCAISSGCGCAGRRKLTLRCLAAVHDGLKVFQSATMQRIQPRSKSRKYGLRSVAI